MLQTRSKFSTLTKLKQNKELVHADNNHNKIKLMEVTLPSDKIKRKYNNKNEKNSVSITEENTEPL